VLVSRFDREPLSGFVNPQNYLLPEGLELLRLFTTRPKMEGLWIRMRFRDGDAMDGLLSNNLLLMEPYGFSVIPPDPGFQNQRVFIPKAAVTGVQVLGVIGSPLRIRKTKPTPKEQIGLFEKPE
jgi:hypothetical protein